MLDLGHIMKTCPAVVLPGGILAGHAADARDAWEQGCRGNPNLIAEAVAAHRQLRGDAMPAELGDLLHEKLPGDPAILQCPAALAAGVGSVTNRGSETDPGAADGREIGYNDELGKSYTEWEGDARGIGDYQFKRMQFDSLAKRYFPIVRCSNHGAQRLNLAADGSIDKSGLYWEENFVDNLPGTRLAPELDSMSHLPMSQLVRPRPSGAADAMPDLRKWFNARFEDPWMYGVPGQERTGFADALAGGLLTSHGIAFEPAGLIQLSGKIEAEAYFEGFGRRMYPTNVNAIGIGRRVEALHVLGGALYGSPKGSVIARLHFHTAEPEEAMTWEWRFGMEVDQLTYGPGEEVDSTETIDAGWTGNYRPGGGTGRKACLFLLRYVNPKPATVIIRLGFADGDGVSAPFTSAITLE